MRSAAAASLASSLPPLLVAAERVAATVAQGVHGRRRSGPGESFWQFRHYHPGDAAYSVDWRQTAKGDHAYVREREWTAAQTICLEVQRGAGMDWRSLPTLPTKGERARLLAAALACLLLRGGERVALTTPPTPPVWGRAALERLVATLEGLWETPETAALPIPPHASAVVLGDFLEPLERVESGWRRLAGGGVRGHVVQVLDPAEESLPWQGRLRFESLDGGEGLMVRRVEDIAQAYHERLNQHRAALQDLARRLGWSFTVHHTTTPAPVPLLALYQSLSGEATR